MSPDPNMSVQELMKILSPTKDEFIENFVKSGVPGVQIQDTRSLELLVAKRPFIVARGLVCNKPQPVQHSTILDDGNVFVIIRQGKLFMINRKAVPSE